MARLSDRGHQLLQELAGRRGQTQQQVLEAALEELRRKQFFEEAHRAYAAVREDPTAAAELEHERAVLDSVLADGLGSDA